jgi:hypothetical protein
VILLNFAHPATPRQLEQIAAIASEMPQVRDVRVQFDLERALAPQIVSLLDELGIASAEWQGGGWLILLPSLNYGAAILLAELHGRMGHFPAIVRLRPVAGAVTTEYEVAEIINLEAVRAEARARR